MHRGTTLLWSLVRMVIEGGCDWDCLPIPWCHVTVRGICRPDPQFVVVQDADVYVSLAVGIFPTFIDTHLEIGALLVVEGIGLTGGRAAAQLLL